ncbi:MAG: hypothetical protein S4CHLAM37_00790 [Chlamydiia bacterium]|nr:hypothetical protein [Chlamydiia bacterium]
MIPCYYKHFCELENLLHEHANQTKLPDEVIIALSESHKVDPEKIEELKAMKWPFDFHMIENEKRLFAGENRNLGVEIAKYELVILIDADDIPHPQRIEMISHAYDKLNFDLLIHSHYYMASKKTAIKPFEHLVPLDILRSATKRPSLKVCYRESCILRKPQPHPGSIAIARRVFDKVKWTSMREHEDTVFCSEVFKAFKKCYFAPLRLFTYRYYKTSKIDRDRP